MSQQIYDRRNLYPMLTEPPRFLSPDEPDSIRIADREEEFDFTRFIVR